MSILKSLWEFFSPTVYVTIGLLILIFVDYYIANGQILNFLESI